MNEAVIDAGEMEADVANAKKMVGDLFQVVGIRKVVIVDDEFSKAPELADLIAAIQVRSANPADFPAVPFLEGIDTSAPAPVLTKQLSGKWDDLGSDARKSVYETVEGATYESPAEGGHGRLNDILKNYGPVVLSLDEWEEQRDSLLNVAKDEPTLFLFDQDMTKNKGDADEGMKLIAALLKDGTLGDKLYFGLFSNSVVVGNEHDKHMEFAKDYHVWEHRNRFAVVAKEHLQKKPSDLVLRFKRIAISPSCERLKKGMFLAINEAVEDARKSLEELDVYDFEQVVFKASFEEGVWEADTLLRLFALYHRDFTRTKAKANNDVVEAANALRRVVSYPYRPTEFSATHLRKLAWLELYESGEYLALHSMPLDLGDIFERTESGARFILIEQPCDLMVRGDDGNRIASHVMLLELLEKPATAEKSSLFWELPFFLEDATRKCVAKLRQRTAIEASVLDLCVFDPQGIAQIQKDAQIPAGLIPAWEKRFGVLLKFAKEKIGQYKGFQKVRLSPEGFSLLHAQITGGVPEVVTGKLDLEAGSLSYNLKRIARLKQPRSAALLRQFASYKARDAFDREFGRVDPPNEG